MKIPSRVYHIRAGNKDGLIYVPVPNDARITIKAEGVEVVNPLFVSSDMFEEFSIDATQDGYFAEHDFDVVGAIPEFPVDVFETESGSSHTVDDSVSSHLDENRIVGFELEIVVVSILLMIIYLRIK